MPTNATRRLQVQESEARTGNRDYHSDKRIEEFRPAPLVRNREVQFARPLSAIPVVHCIPRKFRWKLRDAASSHPGARFCCERVNSEILRLPHRSKE
jgi:hypothetical protein